MTNSISIFQNKNKHKLFAVWMKLDKSHWPWPMSGSCHFNRASYKKFSVKFWIFVSVMFFTRGQVLKFGTPSSSRVFKGALTQKGQFWVNWTSFRPDFNVGWKKNQNKYSKFVTKLVIRRTDPCWNEMLRSQTLE